MTKRIVSGIFILAALGALGVILAGALTSGEQLIVRFLTAVIVAALGLYVISDLRLQTGEADQPMESRPRAEAEPSAPPNSTAAYMATVTNGYGTDPARLARRDAHSERREPAPPQPTRPSMPLVAERPDDFERSPYAPAKPLAEPSEATARVVQSGPPPMPPPGPAPMEPVTKARGRLAALDRDDAVATAPIPITRWTSGDDHGDDGDHSSPIEAEGATPGGSGNGTGDGTATGESVTTDSGSDPTRSAPESAGSSGSVGGSGGDGPTYSNLGSFSYSGRLDTATTWWPEPGAGDRPTTEDSTTGLDGSEDQRFETGDGMTDGEYDPSSAAITNEVVDIRSRLRAVPDYRTDGNGHDDPHSASNVDAAIPNQDADDATIDDATIDNATTDATTDNTTTDDEVTVGDPVILEAPSPESDEAPAEPIAELQGAETVDTGQQMPGHRDPTPYHEDVHHPATEGVAAATPGNEIRSLDAAVEHRQAACLADTPGTPMSMIDLRDGSAVEPEGVVKAIQAGEHQVIQTLIRQGMLSTSGPITDRDVRTMVYVAFTSNELRKLIVAGGRPDTERADLELGPVELFDERRFAPTPRTLYTRPDPRPVELPPTGIEITDDASDIESDPSTEDEPTGATMPAPRHVYRFDSDSSPETVA